MTFNIYIEGSMKSVYSSEWFDSFIHKYDESQFPFQGRSAIFETIVEFASGSKPKTILDLCCGEGFLISHLQRIFPDSHCSGCDFSPVVLQKARDISKEVSWIQCDLNDHNTLLGQAKFDLVVSTYAFHHWPDTEKAKLLLSLVENHLSPGGTILVGDVAFPDADSMRIARDSWKSAWDDNEHYMVFSGLRALLAEEGIRARFLRTSLISGILMASRYCDADLIDQFSFCDLIGS